MATQLTVATVQHACNVDIKANTALSEAGTREAAARGAKLILLPELHRSLYFCQTEDSSCFDLAESIPGPSTEHFARLAKELQVVIVLSLFERRGAGLYHNTAVVLEANGRIAGKYRKMHIPDDPGYYEKYYFTPGDLGFTPIQTSVGKLGVMVCWDQWFPEAARLMALAGADILLYPTAIGWDPRDEDVEQQRQHSAWLTIQQGHAIANGIPVMACNRQGYEQDPGDDTQGIQFWGSSFIAGPQGELLSVSTTGIQQQDKMLKYSPMPQTPPIQTVEKHADTQDQQDCQQQALHIGIAQLDLSRSETVRRAWPFLRDRRIDAYRDINCRYRDK